MNPELFEKLKDLHFKRMTISEYEAQIEAGNIVRRPNYIDDIKFETANPDHPLASTSRFRRIHAADYFRDLFIKMPEAFNLNLLQEMHTACEDCCAAVRLAIVRTVGCLRNPVSVSVLESRIENEDPESWTREAAIQAISVIDEDWYKLTTATHNWFEDWMRAHKESFGGKNNLTKLLKEEDRRSKALACHKLAEQTVLLEQTKLSNLLVSIQESAESIAVPNEEATQLLNIRRKGIGWELQMVGIPIDPIEDNIRIGNNNYLYEFPSTVLLDTTTLKNAESCLRGRVSPVNLLDLSTFCFAAICYDKIVIQPTNLSIIKKFIDLFSPIEYSDGAIPDTLWTICSNLFNSHSPSSPSSKQIEKIWKNFFSLEEIRLNLQSTNEYQNSPYCWDGIPASHFTEKLFSGSGVDTDKISSYLSVQTMRTLFNDVIAGILSIPYISTSIRSSIVSLIMKRKIHLQPVVDSLIENICGAEASVEENTSPYATQISAPFYLGLILEKSNCPDDIIPNILMYRHKAEALRTQLAKDRKAWSGRGRSYIKTICQSVNGFINKDLELAGSTIKTTVSALTPLVTATQPQAQMASLGVKLALLLKPMEKYRELYNRIFRPHIYWLNELSVEAKALRNVDTLLHQVVGHSWTADSRKHLEILANTYPGSFSKIRELC